MIKRVPIQKLTIGMYISDLDCPWMNHPFVTNHFKINDDVTLRKVQSIGLRNVYIDTEKGLAPEEAQHADDIRAEIGARTQKIARAQKAVKNNFSVGEEIAKATQIYKDTHKIIHNLLLDVRLGRQLELEKVEPFVDKMAESIFRNKDALLTLCRVKQKDEYTFMHSVGVAVEMMAFARTKGYTVDEVKQIGMGGILHDVGKMRIPAEIINKPGKLTEEEFLMMQQHVDIGCEIVDKLHGVSLLARDVIAQHHERIDGKGYPVGLVGEQMSTIGKMASIVDVYDALTSNRPYKTAWEPCETLRKVIEWSEHHFDQNLVHQFVHCVGIYPVGTFVQLNDGSYAVVIEQHDSNLLLPKIKVVLDADKHKPSSFRVVDLYDHDDKHDLKITQYIPSGVLNLNATDYLN